jgi:hypothetical protein
MGNDFNRTWSFVMKYLVTGLESSSTKILSKLIAYNLELIDSPDNWDGHEFVFDDNNLVVHRSIPHGLDDFFIDEDFVNEFDYVIISTRDWNCSLLSKIKSHEHDVIKANEQHLKGLDIIKLLINNKGSYIFSSETAFLLQESYTSQFLKTIGIENTKHVVFENPNRRYIKDLGL